MGKERRNIRGKKVSKSENSNSKTFICRDNHHIPHCAFLSRDEIDGVAAVISSFMFLVGTIVLLATTVIEMVEGR